MARTHCRSHYAQIHERPEGVRPSACAPANPHLNPSSHSEHRMPRRCGPHGTGDGLLPAYGAARMTRMQQQAASCARRPRRTRQARRGTVVRRAAHIWQRSAVVCAPESGWRHDDTGSPQWAQRPPRTQHNRGPDGLALPETLLRSTRSHFRSRKLKTTTTNTAAHTPEAQPRLHRDT